MPSIRIHHLHSKTPAAAREAISRIADKIADQFSVDTHWDEDTLHFTRAGVNGTIALEGDQVQVDADLSFFLSPLKGRVESEIRRYLDEQLA